VRDRDSMEQIRVPIEELRSLISDKVDLKQLLKKQA
jgi:glycyl-tRNA synthetase (class II)